jgi:hypothetical protein
MKMMSLYTFIFQIEENTLNKVTIQSFKSTLESLLTQEQLLENEGGEIDMYMLKKDAQKNYKNHLNRKY